MNRTDSVKDHAVLLGLGANLGDPAAQLREALRRLDAHVRVHAVSPVYRSPPVGYAQQPHFLNLVAAGTTRLSPAALLAEAKRIEAAMGRAPTVRNGPRPIDVDLLDHGGRVLREPGLELPHPRMHERAFVMVPLARISPGWRHPVTGSTATELAAGLEPGAGLEFLGPLAPGAP